jgi:methylated-DNA-protein-cysteine methyltransferase related protein
MDDKLKSIWRAVAAIPRGAVGSYGSVARSAGLPGRARLVGHALQVAPAELALPWHRVLNARRRISFPEGSDQHHRQRQLLEREGVRFEGGRAIPATTAIADLDAWLWKPRPGPNHE